MYVLQLYFENKANDLHAKPLSPLLRDVGAAVARDAQQLDVRGRAIKRLIWRWSSYYTFHVFCFEAIILAMTHFDCIVVMSPMLNLISQHVDTESRKFPHRCFPFQGLQHRD